MASEGWASSCLTPGKDRLSKRLLDPASETRRTKEEADMATRLTLRALTGELRGREFALTAPGQITLGRSSDCTVQLPSDASVSRQHCLIELRDHAAWAVDLGSLNG